MNRFIGIIAASGILYAISHFVFLGWVEKPNVNVDAVIQRGVAEENSHLPRMYNKGIREDRIAYANHVVHFYDTIVSAGEVPPEIQQKIEANLRAQYCTGVDQTFSLYKRENISLAYTITSPDPILGDTDWDFQITPQDCTH